MKLPYLSFLDTTIIEVRITNGIDANGGPNVVETYQGLCYFSDKAKTVQTSDGQKVTLNGLVMIGEDIAPDVHVITGSVVINGGEWKIHRGFRAKNPDGTVNHTELELI